MERLRNGIEDMIAEKLEQHAKGQSLSCAELRDLAAAYSELEKNELLRNLTSAVGGPSCGMADKSTMIQSHEKN